MPSLVASAVGDDRLAEVYQLKIHLLGISPYISRRVLVGEQQKVWGISALSQAAGWSGSLRVHQRN